MNSIFVLAAETVPPVTGRIQGGWEFIYAAYLITGAVLLTYSLRLWVLRKSASVLEKSQGSTNP